ncbi:TPA: hypothetical protein IEP28_000627 [Escherichia coli]|nr:hypothetical protein [Escherichia coli]
MESNIKGLVAAGHEMASELKAECGAVDMRSVAKLISDLATQLEVQLVRANALAEDQQKAIESIKQADSAVKLAHEKFSVLAAENAELKSVHPQPFGAEMMKALDAYEKHQDEVPETGMLNAFFILRDSIRVDTPATDAFLDEVRAQARTDFIGSIEWIIRNECNPDKTETIINELQSFADQLRKGGNQ